MKFRLCIKCNKIKALKDFGINSKQIQQII